MWFAANNIRIRIAERAVPLFRWLRVSQIPSSRNRVNQRYTVWCGGKCSGSMRQEQPPRSTKKIAFITSRIGQHRWRPVSAGGGSDGASICHSASTRVAQVVPVMLCPGHALPGPWGSTSKAPGIAGVANSLILRISRPPCRSFETNSITYNQACCCRPPAHCRIRVLGQDAAWPCRPATAP